MTGILAAFFATVACLVVAVGMAFLRFRPVGPDEPLPGAASARLPKAYEVLVMLGQFVWRSTGRSESLRKLLFRAGYRSPQALNAFHGVQFLTALAFAAAIGVLGAKSGQGPILPALAGAGLGFFVPSRVLEWQFRARSLRIRSAVAPALDLIVLALEAGQSVDQALHDTALGLRRVYPDLSSELLFCNLEMRAGTRRTDSLRRLAQRCGEDEVKRMAAILIDGERFGTALGPALHTHARFLRTRMRQRAQEAARGLSVKLVFPVFFLIFPSVMLVTLGPAYFQMEKFFSSFLR